MKALQNIVVGFLVSFVGSIPLGYLNVVGFQIYKKSNINQLVLYLLGVVIIEGFVIYGTLLFAKKLSENEKLLKIISFTSIVFMFVLAIVFYVQMGDHDSSIQKNTPLQYAPFVMGLVLSALNFVQIPFWIGWNLYLVNNKYIFTEKQLKAFYTFGTLVGTFCGMLGFVLLLQFLTNDNKNISANIISMGIPLFFLIMTVVQAVKFWKKYYLD